MRKFLYALTMVGLVAVGLVAQQAGGAFFPGYAYDIPGAWNFSGTIPTLTGNGSVVGTTATQTLSNKTITGASLATTGAVTSSGVASGIGYATGAGCAVTQITSRTTGVTCAGMSGAITTINSSLAAEGTADFTVTDTSVAVGDVVLASIRSGSNGGGTLVVVSTVAAGSFALRVHNGNVASGTAETGVIIINFVVIKAVSA